MPSLEVDNLAPLRVLVIGASYAGLAAGLNLLDLCSGNPARFSPDDPVDSKPRVTQPVKIKFVDERDGYYHLIGSPLALASKNYAAKAWTRFDDIPALRAPGVSWLTGAVGIEIAAELKLVVPQQEVTLIHSRSELLSSEPLPKEFKEQALLLLRDTGVKVLLNHRVVNITPVETSDDSPLLRVTLGDGNELVTPHVDWTISKSTPSTSYLSDTVLDSEGYVKIHPTLCSSSSIPNYEYHFAIGDVASWSGIRRCGGAMFMGHQAAVNIHQLMLQHRFGRVPQLVEIPEFLPMMALALGKKAVVYGQQDGITWGEKSREIIFADDLGFTICWNYLQLGKDGGRYIKV